MLSERMEEMRKRTRRCETGDEEEVVVVKEKKNLVVLDGCSQKTSSSWLKEVLLGDEDQILGGV